MAQYLLSLHSVENEVGPPMSDEGDATVVEGD
jgi:hypothetical protein